MKAGGLRLTGTMTSSHEELKSFLDDLIRRSVYHNSFTVSSINTTPSSSQPSSTNSSAELKQLEIFDPRYTEVSGTADEDRSDLEINVKIFLLTPHPNPRQITEAVSHVLRHLRIDVIDSLVISHIKVGSLGDADEEDELDASNDASNGKIVEDEAEEKDWNEYLKIYTTMEECLKEGKVNQIGVSGFTKDELERLCNTVQHRPSIDEISLQNCCVTPRDLIEYAKPHNIQLFTHNDVKNVLSTLDFWGILQKFGIRSSYASDSKQSLRGKESEEDPADKVQEFTNETVQPKWVVRYSVMVKNRGVVVNKGYIVMADNLTS